MEPTIVQKLLPALKTASSMFEDVTFRCVNPETSDFELSSTKVNSLIVAATSPMLASALLDVQPDDGFTVLVTEGVTIEDLDLFFNSVFSWNLDSCEGDQTFKSIKKVVELLSIKFELENDVETDKLDATTFLPNEAAEKSFKCDDCDATFSSVKLKQRHARTTHSENHPHVCRLCGRRCRGPAGNFFCSAIAHKEQNSSLLPDLSCQLEWRGISSLRLFKHW